MQQETLGDRPGASLRGGWVVWWMGQISVGIDASGAVRMGVAGLAIVPGRHGTGLPRASARADAGW